jgi:hypothetical protein
MTALGRLLEGLRRLAARGDAGDRQLELVGSLAARAAREAALADAEFRVYSQFGEDGIIQYLIQRVPITNEVFVEFGVADYVESNTRFLLVNNNWRGLVLDSGTGHIEFIQQTGLGWRHQIDAVRAFVTRENINGLIRDAGVDGDIGLLSIDLDGNDLWVLEAVDVVTPRILIVEYNATFGAEAAVTVPYDEHFVRGERHYSHLYWGASLAALERVAQAKGFALVTVNRAGNNAFFVRNDVLGDLKVRTAMEAYRPSLFRESRSPAGELTLVGPAKDRLAIIRELQVWDLDRHALVSIADRFGV